MTSAFGTYELIIRVNETLKEYSLCKNMVKLLHDLPEHHYPRSPRISSELPSNYISQEDLNILTR